MFVITKVLYLSHTSNRCCIWSEVKEIVSIVRGVGMLELGCVPVVDDWVLLVSEVGVRPTEASEIGPL